MRITTKDTANGRTALIEVNSMVLKHCPRKMEDLAVRLMMECDFDSVTVIPTA